MLTDYTFDATIYDVIVQVDYWGEGLGARLFEAVVEHPRLQTFARLSLFSREDLFRATNRMGSNARR